MKNIFWIINVLRKNARTCLYTRLSLRSVPGVDFAVKTVPPEPFQGTKRYLTPSTLKNAFIAASA